MLYNEPDHKDLLSKMEPFCKTPRDPSVHPFMAQGASGRMLGDFKKGR